MAGAFRFWVAQRFQRCEVCVFSVWALAPKCVARVPRRESMNKKILPLFLLLALSNLFAADHQWVLKESTLTYHVSHPLHQTEGVSHAARGKGICHEGPVSLYTSPSPRDR